MKNVPNLRFKEFIAEWESKPLGELDVVLTRGPFGSALKKEIMVPKEDNTYKVYEQKHAIQKDSTIGEYYISELKYKELIRFSVSPGDFIMSCSGTIGEIFKIPQNSEKGVINQALLKFSVGNSINEDFFLYSFRKNLQSLETKGSGIKNITSVKFLKDEFIISFPKIEEQKKIASFFSLIDKKIELQTEKVEELKNYKKGIMQKIFSQQLRFKDENGKEFPDWEEKKLENIVEFFKGNGLSKSDLSDNGDIPCVLYGELFTQYDEVINIVKSRCLKDQGFKSEKYDVLMPTSDVTPEGLATASCILVDDVCLGGDINVLRPKKYINGIFLSYQINYFKSLIIRKVSGTTIKHIYVKDIKDIKYNIPCEKEQIKITDLLIQIDNKIKLESLKLESYNELKKGLLQQMFI